MFCLIFSMFINSIFGLVVEATISTFSLTQSRAKTSSQSKFFLVWDISCVVSSYPREHGNTISAKAPVSSPLFRVFLL